MSAQHIEDDIDFALEAGADYIIIDGRGGATGATPLIFRDHISVPTIPALARARRYLDKREARGVTLIVTGGRQHFTMHLQGRFERNLRRFYFFNANRTKSIPNKSTHVITRPFSVFTCSGVFAKSERKSV